MDKGKLDIIIGPMYSGKSARIMQHLLVSAELGLKVLYINNTLDTRTSSDFSTHHPFLAIKQYDNIDFTSVNTLKGLNKEEYDVIGIDEAQFFDRHLIDFCKTHVDTYKKHVIVCGLDGDCQRNKFGNILELIPLCDNITKLHSYCEECGVKKIKAIFTHKLTTATSAEVVDVGGKDKYIPLCRKCYLKYN